MTRSYLNSFRLSVAQYIIICNTDKICQHFLSAFSHQILETWQLNNSVSQHFLFFWCRIPLHFVGAWFTCIQSLCWKRPIADPEATSQQQWWNYWIKLLRVGINFHAISGLIFFRVKSTSFAMRLRIVISSSVDLLNHWKYHHSNVYFFWKNIKKSTHFLSKVKILDCLKLQTRSVNINNEEQVLVSRGKDSK